MSTCYPNTITVGSGATGSTTYTTAGATVGGITTIPIGNVTIGSGNSPYTYSSGTTWTTSPIYTTGSNGSSIKVTGDAEFDGDVKIKGHSLMKLLEKMEDRLAILIDPDPEKLEKFAALKKAYENYKLLEKLCQEEKDK